MHSPTDLKLNEENYNGTLPVWLVYEDLLCFGKTAESSGWHASTDALFY